MITVIIFFISAIAQLLILLIIISALLSFFVDPYHPARRTLNSIVDPMLAPIRRVVPPIGGWDISPIILIILIQILSNFIIRLLR